MNASRGRLQRSLPPHPSSAGEARRMVRRVLAEHGRDDLVETAQLLVSEVVTNALVHSGTWIDLCLSVIDDGMRVEVGDGSPHLPALRSYAPTASTGRGLALVEHAAAAWGVVPSVRGKTVWFQLTDGDDSAEVRPGPAGNHAAHKSGGESAQGRRTPLRGVNGSATVTVTLLNVPLLLHAAWHQHAEALLREYLLTSLGGDSDDPLHVHAAATDAVSLLAEQIPRPQLAGDPSSLMSAAVEPNVSSPRVEMSVPTGSLPHFGILERTLQDAVRLGENGMLLTPPVQPELRSLRRWLCDQVVQQSRGAAPVPWSTEDEPQPPPRRVLAWDASPVKNSRDALVAADDTNRIVAASDSALDLLGYDHARQLVGQRIVVIVPTRYRQAHLAGFTMHLLTGRSPLIRRAVEVPALRRDGSEVAVHLHLDIEPAAHGRRVFVASLQAVD